MNKYPIKIMFYDLETTGTDVRKHGIHQISGLLEIDGVVVWSFNYRVRPHPKAILDPTALSIGHTSEAEVLTYPPMAEIFNVIRANRHSHVDRYDKGDKIYKCGYNSAGFDDPFLRAWFLQNGDKYFGAYFHGEELDVRTLAAQYLLHRRHRMPNFKLATVAAELGIDVDQESLHDAFYDIELTRDVYRIVTGIDFEI